MTPITQAERDELRRLHEEWRTGYPAALAFEAFRDAAKDAALPLLAALAAAEAREARLREALEAMEAALERLEAMEAALAPAKGE